MAKEHQRLNEVNLMSFILITTSVAIVYTCQTGSNLCFTTRMTGPGVITAPKGKYPSIAALFFTNTSAYFCGGTLISNNHVLTAAHCIAPKTYARKLSPNDIFVRLGAYNITINNEKDAVELNVTDIHVHSDWKPNDEKYDADLAILVLNETVTYTEFIQPVSLPDDSVKVDGATVVMTGTIVGWGLVENGRHAEIARQAVIKAVNDSHCYRTQLPIVRLSSSHTFCAGDGDGLPNLGDSGSGFFVNSTSNWVQYGLVSATSTNQLGQIDDSIQFAVFTNVRSYKEWIIDRIGINLRCSYGDEYEFYLCQLHDLDIRNGQVEITSFIGSHDAEKTNQHVNEIRIENGTMYFLLNGIGSCFPNLKLLIVEKCLGTMHIERSNFRNLVYLRDLKIYDNDIEILDENVLWDLPDLEIFQLIGNKVNVLHEKTFDKNLKLNEVLLNRNRLETLPRDLFENLPHLERVDFSGNCLIIIEIDFTKLPVTQFLFKGNICINEDYNTVHNKSVFQSHLRAKCIKK